MPGGTGRCTETATVREYSGNGGAKRGSGGTRPRLDAQVASEAITWVEEAQNIAVEEGHLKRVKPALPEATRRGDAAGGEERGAEPHLCISRDEQLVAVGTVDTKCFDRHPRAAVALGSVLNAHVAAPAKYAGVSAETKGTPSAPNLREMLR